MWAVTGSAFALVGAVLGPTMVIAHWGDARRRARRDARVVADREHRETRQRRAAERERIALDRARSNGAHPSLAAIRAATNWRPAADGRTEIRAGEYSAYGEPGFPWLVDVSRGVAVVGEGIAAESVWRTLHGQISLAHGVGTGDQTIRWPSGVWIHRGVIDAAGVTIACVGHRIDTVAERGQLAVSGNWAPDDATGWDSVLARLPTSRGVVRWDDRQRCAVGVGVSAHGPVVLDLDSSRPHILVCGRTGTGKSEFLAALICDWAERFTPSQLSWVGFDFKGGATLGPLSGLPSCRAVVTDLDGALVDRALAGLSHEMSERERTFVREGVARIDDSRLLGRLVIVVDELPELVRRSAQASAILADIARRGRSLGMHLVLSTQHLGPVNREGLLGNLPVRVCFPMASVHDVMSLTGNRPPEPPRVGRPVIADSDGTVIAVDVRFGANAETCTPRDGASISAPWSSLLQPPVFGSDGFAVIDDNNTRGHDVIRWEPAMGDVVVVGKRGFGRTTALRAITAGHRVTWATTLDGLANASGVVVIDDLDRLVDSLPLNRQHEPAALMSSQRLARTPTVFVVSVATWSPRVHGLVPQVLVLPTVSREAHCATGEPAETFDPSAKPGVGSWRGRRVIVYARTDSIVTEAMP